MCTPEPWQVERWPGGWCLVGDGPSYLLFCPLNKEVKHLTSELHRALRRDLQGYQAIGDDDRLEPLVWALARASAYAIYDLDTAPRRKAAAFTVIQEIQRLIGSFPQPEIFEERLRRLNTLIRAAGVLGMYHGPPAAPGVPTLPSPPGSFFTRDQYGQRLLIVSNPPFVFRCEPNSPIAQCAQKVWREEQAQWGDRTVLYRIPTRAELGEHLCLDKSATTKLCRAEGFNWLPRESAGRPKSGACQRSDSSSESNSLAVQ
jgi:hypothetical protein